MQVLIVDIDADTPRTSFDEIMGVLAEGLKHGQIIVSPPGVTLELMEIEGDELPPIVVKTGDMLKAV